MLRPIIIVIDMCKDFFKEGRLAACRSQMTTATNELTAFFRSQNYPVIWVRQEFRPDLSDAFLSMRKTGKSITIAGTAGAELLPELARSSADSELVKKRYSAFFETELDRLLVHLQPTHVVLAGVNTHACIRTAGIDAYQRDYEVLFAADCINSYDAQFHDESIRYLNGRIGIFLSNAEITRALTPT